MTVSVHTVRLFAVAALVLLLGLAVVPGAEAAFRGHNGRIAFGYVSSIDNDAASNSEKSISDVSPAGRVRRSLVGCFQEQGQPDRGDCSLSYRSPAYSADGQRIVFDSGGVLAVMNADGSGLRRLPKLTDGDSQPAWSPGGSRIIFTGQQGTGPQAHSDLYTVDPLGGHLARLTRRGGSEPVWSAKGTIAFDRGRDVYRVEPSGQGLRRLTYHGGAQPDWSPHATKLAFTRRIKSGQPQTFTVGADGRGLRHLNTSQIDAESPAWSPDGRAIAVHAFEQGIFVFRTAGGKPRPIAGGADGGTYFFDSSEPTWQPQP